MFKGYIQRHAHVYPLTTGVSISTLVLVVKLCRMAEWREQSSSTASLSLGGVAVKDVTVTRILFGISCVFVALFLLNTILLFFFLS